MVNKVEICVGKALPLNPAEGLHASLAEDQANALEMYGEFVNAKSSVHQGIIDSEKCNGKTSAGVAILRAVSPFEIDH